jgi:hypothetical protein
LSFSGIEVNIRMSRNAPKWAQFNDWPPRWCFTANPTSRFRQRIQSLEAQASRR